MQRATCLPDNELSVTGHPPLVLAVALLQRQRLLRQPQRQWQQRTARTTKTTQSGLSVAAVCHRIPSNEVARGGSLRHRAGWFGNRVTYSPSRSWSLAVSRSFSLVSFYYSPLLVLASSRSPVHHPSSNLYFLLRRILGIIQLAHVSH